ncbi:MAG: class II aldolase/adducin family protein [Terriglobales bacterium]
MNERHEIASVARSLYDRNYTFGTAGNISVRLGDHVLVTPTNSSFFDLVPESISESGLDGTALSGLPPSKELPFHLAIYHRRPEASAVVHLHSCYATAVSCLENLNVEDAIPIYTPYYAMRLPRLPVADYYPPGDPALARAVEQTAGVSNAMLLRNHGSIAIGQTLMEAAALAQEIEEQARLFFLLEGRGHALSQTQVAELRRRFR